jgi:phenylacetate-CoA ligase
MGFQAKMLKKFPGIIKYANSEGAILKRLKKAVDYAYKSKMYAKKLKAAKVSSSDIRSIEDFKRKVPLTTKKDLLSGSPYDLLAVSPGEKCLIYSQTSGTTGGHVPIWVTQTELERFVDLAICLPVFQDLLSPEDRVAICYPYTRTMAGRVADMINQTAKTTIIPMGTRNNMYPPSEVVDTMIRLKPTILGAMATDALAYANILLDRGLDPKNVGIRLIVSGAEPCSDNRGAALGEVFDAKFLSLLGQNEIGGMAPCAENNLHLPNFAMFTEIYHEDGTEAEPGDRALSVVTPTWREAMPLLRYETGDKIIIEKDPCPCNLPLPTMKILGRKRTELFIGGKSFFPIELENVLYKAKLDGVWYQMIIRENEITIKAEHRKVEDYTRLKETIHSNFGSLLKMDINVEMVAPGSLYDYNKIRPGKPLSRVVDETQGRSEIIEGA